MNKKFLSAVLFGALMVSSTGTFVSCKDYDEDIDRIDQELTEIRTAIAALQKKVDEGKYVTNVVKNGEGITITWNDNSTSTIETIKGENGADGKNGTVVTIIDGYWAFDGVKSEYPAKGDKGDKGDQGEPGDAAAAGHDAKISDDGYWMVWDAEAGEYKKTEYIAGGAMAVEGEHGWTIIVRDEKGQEQSIYIPNSADLVSIQEAKDSQGGELDIFYGLVKTPVDWNGAKAVNGKMEAGMYPVLEKDVQIMLNPTGVDGTAYEFEFRNSDNQKPWGLELGEIRPYSGALLTRAASSASGIWELPRHIQRIDLNGLDERADYITQFKSNDGDTYAFALNATSKEDASKVIKSQYIYSFDPTNVGDLDAKEFEYKISHDKNHYIWNEWHKPNLEAWKSSIKLATSSEYINLFQVIYDYKLEIDKTKMTQVNIEKYGLEISEDGYTFRATKEAAVDNKAYFKLTYILINGSKYTKDFYVNIVAKDIVVTDNNIGTLDKAFNATQLGTVAAKTNATQIAALDNKFVYTDKLTFDPKEKLGANYDEWIDAMYQALNTTVWTDADRAKFLQGQASIVGGDPINNDAEYNNALINNLVYFDYVDASGKSCIYDVDVVNGESRLARLGEIAALEIHFVAGAYNRSVVSQFAVQAPYYTQDGTKNWGSTNAFAIPLNNAFSVQLLTEKEDQPVAALNFKFQLTQPDINKVGILPQNNGLFTLWKDEIDKNSGKKTADLLFSFGAYDNVRMGLPLYEAFDMWTGKTPSIYTDKNKNASYYTLLTDGRIAGPSVTFIGQTGLMENNLGSNDFSYSGTWTDYTTWADKVLGRNFLGNAVVDNTRAMLDVDVKYNFFGVYPALAEQLPFYTDGAGDKQSGFRLIFASTIKEASMKMNEDIYYANAGTNDIAIANTDITAKTMLTKDFVLFAGIDANGAVISRADLNKERGFNETQRPFATPVDYEIAAKYVGNNASITVDSIVDLSRSSSSWNVDINNATIKPKITAAPTNNHIKIYNVASSQKYPVGHSTYVNGLPAYAAGYVIQLGEQIEDRQPIEISIKVKDNLGFYNVLKIKVQKLK